MQVISRGYRIFTGPWSWFSSIPGGMERMIASPPLIIWAIGTGAYLMAPERG